MALDQVSDALKQAFWKQDQRSLADKHLARVLDPEISPKERFAHLDGLIVTIAHVEDPAITKFYGNELAKRKHKTTEQDQTFSLF